jgi:hypothetical protein
MPKYETDEYDADMLHSVGVCLEDARNNLDDLINTVLRAKVGVSMRSAESNSTRDAFLAGELKGCREDISELLGELRGQIYTAKELFKGRMW